MKYCIEYYVQLFSDNKFLKKFGTTMAATFASGFFALYNAYLGVFRGSSFSNSIFVYYSLLTVLRLCILGSEAMFRSADIEKIERHRMERWVYIVTGSLMIALNLALITPIDLMLEGLRGFDFGFWGAVIMGLYTIYKVIFSIVHYRRARSGKNLLIKETCTINLIDACVAILTLMNTFIVCSGGYTVQRHQYAAYFSSVMLAIIILMTVFIFFRDLREYKD